MSTMTKKQMEDLKAKIAKQEEAVEKSRSAVNEAKADFAKEQSKLDELKIKMPEPSQTEVISGYLSGQRKLAREHSRLKAEQQEAMRRMLEGDKGESGKGESDKGSNKA